MKRTICSKVIIKHVSGAGPCHSACLDEVVLQFIKSQGGLTVQGAEYVMLYYVMLLCYVTVCYGMLCYRMLCYAMLCYITVCYVMLLCYCMLCFVMLCYVLFFHVMLCYIMFKTLWLFSVIIQKIIRHVNNRPTSMSCMLINIKYKIVFHRCVFHLALN